MSEYKMSWEESISWLKHQPDQADFVRACFYDDPLYDSAQRYALSEEWHAVRKLLPVKLGMALDLGAGRGISSFALARDGWNTFALEPNGSEIAGAAAIRKLSIESNLQIKVVEEWGEKLPFIDNSFDLVHCRQVLHHAKDLNQLCREISRVLKPGGTFIATREHVISKHEDLDYFLANHALHKLYGGEYAYLLQEYLDSIQGSGIKLNLILNPYQSDINLYPDTTEKLRKRIAKKLSIPAALVPVFILGWIGSVSNAPGRLYTFVGRKL